MRQYELLLVVRPDFEYSDTKKVNELIKKSLAELPATVKEVNVLGKKPLAYPINKASEGVYLLASLETSQALPVSTLEKQMRLGNDVLRFLLTLKEG